MDPSHVSQASNVFPWVLTIQKEFLRSFPRDYDSNTLQCFYKCIEDELVGSKTHSRRCTLFETLIQFYNHFCWKIKWDKPCPDMKEACVLLLANVIKVGVELSSRDPDANFCNRVIFAVKMFPGEDSLLYTSLLRVTHLKKKFHKPYATVIKQILFSSRLVLTTPEEYLKVVFLLRRLKSILNNQTEKTKVHQLASGLKPPPNTLQWISSYCPGLSRTKVLTNKLMAKKVPVEVYRKLREVLLPGLGAKKKPSRKDVELVQVGSFVIDPVPRAENDLEIQNLGSDSDLPALQLSAECNNSSSKRSSSIKRKAFCDEVLSPKLKPFSSTASIKKAKKNRMVCQYHNDSHSEPLCCDTVEVEGTLQSDTIHVASPVSATFTSSNTSSKKKVKNKKKRKITNNIIEIETSVVQEDDSLAEEHPDLESLKKSKRLLSTKSQLDSGEKNNSSTCHAKEIPANEVVDGKTSSSEEILGKTSAPTKRKRRKLPSELDFEARSLDQNKASSADCEQVNENVVIQNASTSEHFVPSSALTEYSKRLHATDSKLNSVSKLFNQNETSICPAGIKQENEDADPQTFSSEDVIPSSAPTRKSKRLHAVDNKLDSETKTLDENETSACSSDSKQEIQDADSPTLSSEEFIPLSAPTRKSKRVHVADSKVDSEAKTLIQNEASTSADCKQEIRDADSPTLSFEDSVPSSAPTRKSERLIFVKCELYSETKHLSQNQISTYPKHSKQEGEAVDAKICPAGEHLVQICPDIKNEINSGKKTKDQNETPTCTLSTSEHLTPSSLPVGTNRSFPIVSSKLQCSAEAVKKDKSIDFTKIKQEENESGKDISCNRESPVKSLHSPIRKSKRLLAMDPSNLSDSDPISTTGGSNSELHDSKFSVDKNQLVEVDIKIRPCGFPTGRRSTQPSSERISSEVKEEDNFQVIETDTGYKITSSFKQRPSFESSSNVAKSDVLKTSIDSPSSCQNIPVVVISPAEGADPSIKQDASGVDNHLLHPFNCNANYSTPMDSRRPDFDERKVSRQLNESKPNIKSKSSELCNHSVLKTEGSPSKCHQSQKTPVSNENIKIKSFDMKVEVTNVNENAVEHVVDKILTSIENAEPIKFVPMKSAAACPRSLQNNLGAVPGMTFSPFIRKAKQYMTFSDVKQENKPSLLRDTLCKQTKSQEFSGYRGLLDDVCDSKSEGVMSDVTKMDHISSDASVYDSNNEDSEEVESCQELACPITKEFSDEASCLESRSAEVKVEENQTDLKNNESNDCSPVDDPKAPERTTVSATAADIRDDRHSGDDVSGKNPNDDHTRLPVGIEMSDSFQPTVDIVKLESNSAMHSPAKRLRSKKAAGGPSKENKETSLKKDLAGCSSGTASCGYSLRRTTRSKAAQDNVNLGLDFDKLSLGSPKPSRKVTIKVELEEVPVEAKPSKRVTRCSSQVSESSSQSLKPKEPASNTEGHNLRRSKRSVVLQPAKLKL